MESDLECRKETILAELGQKNRASKTSSGIPKICRCYVQTLLRSILLISIQEMTYVYDTDDLNEDDDQGSWTEWVGGRGCSR